MKKERFLIGMFKDFNKLLSSGYDKCYLILYMVR